MIYRSGTGVAFVLCERKRIYILFLDHSIFMVWVKPPQLSQKYRIISRILTGTEYLDKIHITKSIQHILVVHKYKSASFDTIQ